MKKLLFLLFLFLIPVVHLFAQNYNNVRLVEFELGMGPNIGNKYNGAKSEIGGQFLAEIRLNMKESPIDAGLQLSLSFLSRKGTSTYYYDHSISHTILTTYVDYNFRKWKRMSLFGGFGIGFAFVDNGYDTTIPGSQDDFTVLDRSFLLSPRIGVEFFNRVRLTIDYKMLSKEYAYFGASVGFVFGGGYKNK